MDISDRFARGITSWATLMRRPDAPPWAEVQELIADRCGKVAALLIERLTWEADNNGRGRDIMGCATAVEKLVHVAQLLSGAVTSRTEQHQLPSSLKAIEARLQEMYGIAESRPDPDVVDGEIVD